MTEGIERLRPKKSPGRPPALNEEMLERLKGLLETRPYWSLREVRRLIKRTRLSKASNRIHPWAWPGTGLEEHQKDYLNSVHKAN